MRRIKWQNLISFSDLDDKNKLRSKSVMDIVVDQKRIKNNEIVLILLITIFILFFFAQNVEAFLILLFSALAIGIFGLIQDYRNRRR